MAATVSRTAVPLSSSAAHQPTSLLRLVPGLDGGYAGIIPYLDKLGLAARHGHSAVVRQALPHMLLPPADADDDGGSSGGLPTVVPGWWAASLWSKLWGTRALAISGDTSGGRMLRAYASCGRDTGTVVVLLVNLRSADTCVSLQVNGRLSSTIDTYALAPFPDPANITSPHVSLNGKALKPSATGSPGSEPPMLPLPQPASAPACLPARGVGFYVIESPPSSVCLGKAVKD